MWSGHRSICTLVRTVFPRASLVAHRDHGRSGRDRSQLVFSRTRTGEKKEKGESLKRISVRLFVALMAVTMGSGCTAVCTHQVTYPVQFTIPAPEQVVSPPEPKSDPAPPAEEPERVTPTSLDVSVG